MFGAKYSRLKFWIWSIILLFIECPAIIFFKIFEQSVDYREPLMIVSILIILISAIWMNVLANRIRDYGDNPWTALFSIVPLANIGLALYYGIAKSNIKEVPKKNDTNSLSSAVYNHSKDIINGIKPAINEYKETHTTPKLNNDIKSFTIDEISNHPDRVQIDDFDNTYFTKLKETKINYLTEDEIYEKIMIEIEIDNKVKSTWARALAQSDGNKDKAESLYIKFRFDNLNNCTCKNTELTKNENYTKNNSEKVEEIKINIQIPRNDNEFTRIHCPYCNKSVYLKDTNCHNCGKDFRKIEQNIIDKVSIQDGKKFIIKNKIEQEITSLLDGNFRIVRKALDINKNQNCALNDYLIDENGFEYLLLEHKNDYLLVSSYGINAQFNF